MGKIQKSKGRNNRLESAWSLHAYLKKQTNEDIFYNRRESLAISKLKTQTGMIW